MGGGARQKSIFLYFFHYGKISKKETLQNAIKILREKKWSVNSGEIGWGGGGGERKVWTNSIISFFNTSLKL